MEGVQPFSQLLDLLPDVAFFMKDRRGRFVMHNRRGYEYCQVSSERETIGKTEHDFYPKDRADLYIEGDRQVMRTGIPIINAIAPAPEGEGSDKLIVYSKVAVRDRRGRIIGIAGIHREVEGMRTTPKSYGRLSRAVEHLHNHYAAPASLPRWSASPTASSTGYSANSSARPCAVTFCSPASTPPAGSCRKPTEVSPISP